jgi:hypothetical protein
MAAADDSDYGDELNWDDEELETQLTAIENGPAHPQSATRPELARVEIALEGAVPVVEASKHGENASGSSKTTADALEMLENGSSAAGPSLSLW